MDFYDNLLDGAAHPEQGAKKLSGVTTAIVTQNWDDKHPGMVRVELYMAEEGKNLTGWVRVARPYAGKEYGVYMLPEVGDEVLVAFHLGDPNRPYVIGSLWNNVDTIPPETAVEKNTVKRVTTKGGHELVFGEEEGKEAITLTTPGKLKLTLEDEKKTITIQDADGKNLLIINGDEGAITVKAEKKIVLDAGGASTLTLNGEGKSAELKADSITIEAGQKLGLKGQNATLEGGAALNLKSGGNAKAEASGMLEVKGAMVKIN